MKKIAFFVALFLPFFGFSQESSQNIRYNVEPTIEKTQQHYADTWKKLGKTKVFVVQVSSFSGENSSAKAQAAASSLDVLLQENGSTAKAYVIFQEPAFKVRIGDFRHRNEAYGALLQIQSQYPGAFVTTDLRKLSEIAE